MSYVTPKTDWVNGDYCTYTDVNRIMDNVNELLGESLKDDYTVTDMLDKATWENMAEAVADAAEGITQYAGAIPEWPGDDITDDMTANNFNVAESWALVLHRKEEIDARSAEIRPYCGEDLFVSALPENYVR